VSVKRKASLRGESVGSSSASMMIRSCTTSGTRLDAIGPRRAVISRFEPAEFRQFRDQDPGDCLSDAWRGSEQILFLDQAADPRI
jgi:hypothetical protein